MDDNVESNSPAVVDGTVYIANNNTVFAIDKNSGEKTWSAELNGNPISDSPQIVDDILYIADQRRIVYALDIHSGQVIWTSDSEETSTLSRARTTVYGKTVFVATGSDDNSQNGWIRALGTADGETLWEYQTDGSVSESYPVYKDGIVYAGDFHGHMYAIDARSGEEVWFFNSSHTHVHSSPAVHSGVVYMAVSQVLAEDGSSDVPLYDGYLYALDAYTGKEIWTEPIVDSVGVGGMYSTPTVLDDILYIGFGTKLKAFDINDRELVWEYETAVFQWIKSSPTIADGVVFFASRDRHIYALDAADGTELWQLETPYLARSSPVVVDGVLYIGADRFDIDDSGSDFPENVVEGYLYAIASGVDGSSEGSRIDLGVINHHFGMLPFMGLEVVSTNSPVDEGDPVEIEVAVRNTGIETTRSITLRNFDAEIVDQQEVTVGRNETETITLGWDTSTGDASYGDAVISSDNDSISERIVIMRQHTINGCEDISVPGYYLMANSVGVNATCITITSSHVVLDGNMEEIRQLSNSDASGILIDGGAEGIQDVSVKNYVIKDFEVGALTNGAITIYNLNGGTFSNLILRNSHWGIQGNYTTNILVKDSHFDDINWWGIYMDNSTNNEFRNNEINDTFYGVLLYENSHDNLIRNNYIHNNSFGIVVQNSNGAEIIGNKSFDNTRNSELGDVYVWRGSSNAFVDQFNAGISGESDLTISYQADDIQFQAVGAPAKPHPELSSLSKYFEVNINNSSGLLDIEIHYDASDYSELELESLGLWRFDPDSGVESWTPVADVSVTETEIKATINKDGVYGAFSGQAVVSAEPEEQPVTFELRQNYPNPFNPTTTIEYVLPEAAEVRLHVYNVLGRRVATLVREYQTTGVHQTVFDASGLASGVYFYLIEAGSHTQNRQMLLVK